MSEVITIPKYPRFLWATDQNTSQSYIICTNPLALIWVRRTHPEQLFVIEGPQDAFLILEAKQWYLKQTEKSL